MNNKLVYGTTGNIKELYKYKEDIYRTIGKVIELIKTPSHSHHGYKYEKTNAQTGEKLYSNDLITYYRV